MSRTKTNQRTDRETAYKIKCCDCQATYLGETGRKLSTRLTAHKRVTRKMVTSTITLLNTIYRHQINGDSVTCITYSTDYYQRLSLENWFMN